MKKKVIYSGAVLLLIIFAMLIANFLENSQEKRNSSPFFPGFAENAGKIILTQGENSVILLQDGSRWFVAFAEVPDLQYSADSVKILSVIQKIAEMRQDNFVSKNSNNLALYGLVGDSVYSVQIFDKNKRKVGDFLLGRRSENWRFNYFKLASENSVFMVGGGIGYAFNTEINEWRDKRIFHFNPADIVEIEAIEGGTKNSISKDSEGNWTFADRSSANSDTIRNYIAEFAGLTAGDWDYTYSLPDGISGLDNPSAFYTLISKDGEKFTLAVGNPDGERPRFFVRYNDNPQIAFVFRSQISRLRFQ